MAAMACVAISAKRQRQRRAPTKARRRHSRRWRGKWLRHLRTQQQQTTDKTTRVRTHADANDSGNDKIIYLKMEATQKELQKAIDRKAKIKVVYNKYKILS